MNKIIIIVMYMLILVIATMIPIKVTDYLYKKKKVLINRWIYGFLGFFILTIPQFIFKSIPKSLLMVMYIVFFFLIIMFFETSRINVEKKQMKTMFDYTWLAKKTMKENQKN